MTPEKDGVTARAERVDIVCFGEVLTRLSTPDRGLLARAKTLDVHSGGAEANVAVAIAALGGRSAMLTALPHGALGDGALAFLRSVGVGTEGVRRAAGRQGLYFLTPGASLRASEVIYDRNHSAFVTFDWTSIDWTATLAGARWLHVSGITPALGPALAEATCAAMAAARALGVRVSFDGNYRARLWEASGRDPRAVLCELVALADLFFANHRDMALLLDRPFSGEGSARRREAAEAGFAAFPNLRWIASTNRRVNHVDLHSLAARIDTPDAAQETDEVEIAGIIDRIGAGDAFAAGVLHGLLGGQGEGEAVRSGLALACLKHSLPGDAALLAQRDIDAFLAGDYDVRR